MLDPLLVLGGLVMSDRNDAASNPYAPPQAEVRDVATPQTEQVPAGRGARFGAAIVDGLIIGGPSAVAGGIIGFNAAASAARGGGSPPDAAALSAFAGPVGMTIIAIAAIWYLIWAVITFRLVKRNGQTIAKKWFGIKVVRADGSPASVGRIFWLRNFVNGIPGAIPLLGLIYVLVDHCLIFGERRRCLHDLLADTKVVEA